VSISDEPTNKALDNKPINAYFMINYFLFIKTNNEFAHKCEHRF